MAEIQIAIVDTHLLLEKFPGKGGWTYARIPMTPQEKKSYFGQHKVKGFIDDYELNGCHLMSMGKGQWFLPVKAEIRKKIKKEAGDSVKLILFLDEEPALNQQDFFDCLNDEPDALNNYNKLAGADKNKVLNWLDAAKINEDKIERIATIITELVNGRM